MESFVNQPFLKKRATFARWGSYVGFGALFIGLMTTSRSPVLAYVFLLIGLLGASLGSYMASRYVREPRTDQVLEEKLVGLDKRYTIYNYYLPSNHVIISHHGMTVVEPRAHTGEISYDQGRWRHKAGFRKILQLFGEPSLGKPDQDLKREVDWLKEWIDEVMPNDNIPVNGAVVFTQDAVELHASGNAIPIVAVSDLARHMKEGLKGQPVLTTAKQKELRRVLDEAIGQS